MVEASSLEVGPHDWAAAADDDYFDRLPAVPAISNSPVWQAAGNDSSQFDPRCPEWAEQVRGVKLVIGVDRTGSVSDSELGECWENTQAD